MWNLFREEDKRYYEMLEKISLLEEGKLPEETVSKKIRTYPVYMPEAGFEFLHEAAIIEYHGTLFASWYNCPVNELRGYTPIRGRRSKDGGKTWSEVEVLAEDKEEKILYCPPVYGICDDVLYLFMNEMVGPDLIHALDLYRYNEEKDRFELLWSRPIPFKLNTNVYELANGKRLLPGRIAELDGFPNTPAVLISDSGKIDAEWRLVYIQPDGNLADGSKLVHPEISAIVDGEQIEMFCRDDERRVPLLYRSEDNGENWSGPYAIDLPFSGSKIYSGTLSNGRNYVIGNILPDRKKLVIFLSEPDKMKFNKCFVLQNGYSEELGIGKDQWSYPVACEADGMLYIIYTAEIEHPKRGAVVSVMPIDL